MICGKNMNVKIWNKDIMKFCPGIGKGKLYSFYEIKNIISRDIINNKNTLNLTYKNLVKAPGLEPGTQ